MKQKFWPLALIVVLLVACGRPADQAKTTYETVAASKRDIRVAVEAAGQIEPALTVELKSNHLGTARDGTLTCEARMVHGGRTTQVWDTEAKHVETGKVITLFRCTQMILYPK